MNQLVCTVPVGHMGVLGGRGEKAEIERGKDGREVVGCGLSRRETN
jgi:hypothetical protein